MNILEPEAIPALYFSSYSESLILAGKPIASFSGFCYYATALGFSAPLPHHAGRCRSLSGKIHALTAAEIRALRLGMGLTVERFCLLLRVGRTAVTNWEQGISSPNEIHNYMLDVVRKLWEAAHPQLVAEVNQLQNTKGDILKRQLQNLKSDRSSGSTYCQRIRYLKDIPATQPIRTSRHT